MFQFYGTAPPNQLTAIRLGDVCPQCHRGSRFTLLLYPDFQTVRQWGVAEFVAGYGCELCLAPLGILWRIFDWPDNNQPRVIEPRMLVRTREAFDLSHVPTAVGTEIEEALDCLSVNAFNGFASLCRRAVQAISTNLGATGTSKVQAQINEMAEITGLDEETKEVAVQVMLTGHDGAHPHLPEVNAERAAVLLSLLKDLAYQLYTRPGNVKAAAELRKQAIARGGGKGS